jgi:hypothetical protein
MQNRPGRRLYFLEGEGIYEESGTGWNTRIVSFRFPTCTKNAMVGDYPRVSRKLKSGDSSANKSFKEKLEMKKLGVAVFLVALLLNINAVAGSTDWNVNAHVTVVEGTYMPNSITFQLDTTAGPCSAGSWLEYDGQGSDTPTQQANAKSIYALLLASKLSGQSVTLYGSNTLNSNGFCVVSHVWAH